MFTKTQSSTPREVEVYQTLWSRDHVSQAPLGDYNGFTLSEAEDDLRARGYECQNPGKAGRANIITSWIHPTSGIRWDLVVA